MKLEDIDKNLKVDKEIDKTGLKFYHFEDEPLKLYGDIRRGEDGLLYRLPREVAEKTNPGVLALSTNTAGGRVRFRSNTGYVAVIAKYNNVSQMPHFSVTGRRGMDLYADGIFISTFIPPNEMPNLAFESKVGVSGEKKERDFTINLPTYENLIDLYVGIEERATLTAPTPYRNEKPIVFYGSSITQGACASRPGNTYISHLSRWLDTDFINLGFSGSARGEEAIIEYIAGLDMSVFVCDYDYNAPTVEHLEKTHLPLYRKVREKNPDLPIIFMTRPSGALYSDRLPRRAVVKKTYDTAVSEGDKNVYFLDPTEHMPFMADEGTVEACHPNDLGFYFMARALLPILEELIL